MAQIIPSGLSVGGRRRTLAVLLHAYTHGSESLTHVADMVRRCDPDADVLLPRLPFDQWSTADMAAVVASVVRAIDEAWQARGRGDSQYERVWLVGHSIGALVARAAYLAGCGWASDCFDAPVTDEVRPWAARVDRIVLLAGMNRGWTLSHHLSLKNAALWSVGMVLATALRVIRRRTFVIMQIRRGSPFITQMRIQWLAMRRYAARHRTAQGSALTVQLLGTVDDVVGPNDNIDLVTGRDFVYLDVPRSGHANVIEMDDSEAGRARRGVFELALRSTPAELEAVAIRPADFKPQQPRDEVTDVVFVIHGIRDEGFWTQRIARRVQALARTEDLAFETETSGYGYFPMLPFLLSSGRRKKVEWLMDQYTEDLALYPNARFSFVGHSNGTYLLGRALELYPTVRFKHVVFAGSVVRTSFDWGRFIAAGRVEKVLNYVATADWVVACLPGAWEKVHVQDLGAAGSNGFRGPEAAQIRYVRGGHSAALDERNWDAIAQFIVHGTLPAVPAELAAETPSRLVRRLGAVAPALWIVGVASLALVGLALWGAVAHEPARTLALLAYMAGIWLVVTRL